MIIGDGGNKISITPEGGYLIYLLNDTGSPSIKGELVNTNGGVDNSYIVAPANTPDMIGAVYQSGIADGELVPIVISGIAEVLIEDGTTATRGYWVRISITQKGRANILNATPPGGGISEIDAHLEECGHCLESKAAGTNVLTKIVIHFN